MRAATIVVAIMGLLAGPAPVGAASVDVAVRIEGATGTLFDRLVRTDGHDVQASSDVAAHRCDGTNGDSLPAPGPTATAATVDALATLGETFDGQWHPGFDDYFVTRLGPDAEDNDRFWWWGVLIDHAFASVGGCQARVEAGDEVLWVYDAFGDRPFLHLDAPPTMPVGGPPTVLVDAPLAVSVTSSAVGDGAGGPGYAGARIEAVTAGGQPAAAGVADGGVSDADGSATVVFHASGWQRLKARDPGPGDHPLAVASNSVDVCVEATPGGGCAGVPPSRQAVIPPSAPDPPGPDPGPQPNPGTGQSPGTGAPPGAGSGGSPSGDRSSRRPTVPIAPPAWARRFVDGTLRDDRARSLSWRGSWRRATAPGAWHRTLTRGAAGATVRARLSRGRPAFALRTDGRPAHIELRVRGRSLHVALGAGASITRLVRAPRLTRAGVVELLVLRGRVSIDGLGHAA